MTDTKNAKVSDNADSSAPVSHKTLASALVAAQRDMPTVTTDAENPHFHSKFASLPHVVESVIPVFLKHGIAVIQSPFNDDMGIGVQTTLEHESGESREYHVTLPLTKQDPQGGGSAITYARRYVLCGLAGIAPDDDDDANDASTKPDEDTTQDEPPVKRPAFKKVSPVDTPALEEGAVLVTGVTEGSKGWHTIQFSDGTKGDTKHQGRVNAARMYCDDRTPVRVEISSKVNGKFTNYWLDTIVPVSAVTMPQAGRGAIPTSNEPPDEEEPPDLSDLPF